MSFFEVLLIALGLSMDAFAVSVCKGVVLDGRVMSASFITGCYFGVFQALMPLAGYLIGATFADKVERFSPYIAFALLCFIGVKMLKEGFDKKEFKTEIGGFSFFEMTALAVATSIDALAVGVAFSLRSDVNVYASVCLIGIVAFSVSALGIK